MSRKTLKVQVEIDIQAVTCPGVWLCPNGKISLQVCILDSCIQTTGLLPNFPLLYHEKYIFYKVFYDARSLSDLHRLLNEEYMYAELIQWQSCDMGNVIASFQTSLCDVLYPSAYEGTVAGIDVDLLMEPSRNFPGIISPKIEISTRTTVEESVCSIDATMQDPYVINPKTLTSDLHPDAPKRNKNRQQKVCHSLGYHRNSRCVKSNKASNPKPFTFRRVDENMIGRTPTFYKDDVVDANDIKKCTCRPRQRGRTSKPQPKTNYGVQCENKNVSLTARGMFQRAAQRAIQSGRENRASSTDRYGNTNGMTCTCDRGGHSYNDCPVCSKYSSYFEGESGKVASNSGCDPPKIHYVRRLRSTSQVRPENEDADEKCGCERSVRDSRIQHDVQGCKCCCNRDTTNRQNKSAVVVRPKKLTMAEKLHSRLTQTLAECVSSPPYVVECGSPGGRCYNCSSA